jgi:hypothetical protein
MQNLNCKPGDLAIVVNAILPQNLGQIVEVLGPQADRPFKLQGPGHIWRVRVITGRESLFYLFSESARVVRHVEGPVPDCRLRPVSGLQGECGDGGAAHLPVAVLAIC